MDDPPPEISNAVKILSDDTVKTICEEGPDHGDGDAALMYDMQRKMHEDDEREHREFKLLCMLRFNIVDQRIMGAGQDVAGADSHIDLTAPGDVCAASGGRRRRRRRREPRGSPQRAPGCAGHTVPAATAAASKR